MEGPFQLATSVIDTIINKMDPAVFLLRRIEETPKIHTLSCTCWLHRWQSCGDAETVA